MLISGRRGTQRWAWPVLCPPAPSYGAREPGGRWNGHPGGNTVLIGQRQAEGWCWVFSWRHNSLSQMVPACSSGWCKEDLWGWGPHQCVTGVETFLSPVLVQGSTWEWLALLPPVLFCRAASLQMAGHMVIEVAYICKWVLFTIIY